MMVRRGSSEKQQDTELDRVQQLFPYDNLRLNEQDTLARRGLLRSKSAATLKLQRALSGPTTRDSGPVRHKTTRRQVSAPLAVPVRTLLMEAPVKLTTGVQSQDRHLFLFHDLLLIAKPRSSSGVGQHFKLKDKVLVCEMWLSDQGMEQVAEVALDKENSFVFGWPTTNHVVTFRSCRTKELWRSKLEQLLIEAKEREGLVTTTIPVTFLDPSQRLECPKIIKATNTQTTSDLIQVLLKQLGIQVAECSSYQLWVKTNKDDSPYPLFGHEFPFSIKMNLIRDLLQRSELDLRSVGGLSTDIKCSFILRRNSYDVSSKGIFLEKRARKTSRLVWPFFRLRTQAVGKVPAGGLKTPPIVESPTGRFFGQSLQSLIGTGEELPQPLQIILQQLYVKGPKTVGIFRKSGNARLSREIRERIEAEEPINWDTVPLVTLASILKEFLRGLPDCLLQCSLSEEWLDSVSRDSQLLRRKQIIGVVSKLEPCNRLVLVHLLCLLSRISQDAHKNKMSSENLAVCIGPSLLPSPSSDVSKKVAKLVTFLIEDWSALFDAEPLQLFSGIGCTYDSGAEDSGSAPGGSFPLRDDSSLDSIEDEEEEARAPCVSLTNLSHDSGLMLSDTQLYTPDEEMGLEDSCYHAASPHRAKSVPFLFNETEAPQQQPCITAERAKQSVRATAPDIGDRLRRSASEESLLEKYMGRGTLRRKIVHHKGRAPSPPAYVHNVHERNQAVWFAEHLSQMDWNRCQSTSKIDTSDRPTSYSTSNPMVARSCVDVYGNILTMHCLPPSEPPSYDEALTRRNLLRRLQTPPNARPVTDQMRQEQTMLSAKARQLYEESLRLYNDRAARVLLDDRVTKNDRLHHLPPVHVSEDQIASSRPAQRVIAYQRTWKPRPDIPDDLQDGINWSVAQLRTLFCRKDLPPPYRDPPPGPGAKEESFV